MLWFVRGNLVRDVAALNKMELLPWDVWGLADEGSGLTADDMTALDEMAALSGGDAADFDRIHAWYETDARWRVPPVIVSYTPAGPVSVPL